MMIDRPWIAGLCTYDIKAPKLSRRVSRSKSSRFTKNHRRDCPVRDLAHGDARLNPRHPRQSRELGSVNAFEILDIARQDNDDVVVASRHQEAPNHRWTVASNDFNASSL